MEKFESLRSIIKEFGIKERFVAQSGFHISECEQYKEVTYAPSSRLYRNKPIIVDGSGVEITYGFEDEKHSILRHTTGGSSQETAPSSSGSLFYANNSTGLTQNLSSCQIKDPLSESSDFILDSTLASKDSMLSEGNDIILESKNESMLSSEAGNPQIIPSSAGNLASEPFELLPSEDYGM